MSKRIFVVYTPYQLMCAVNIIRDTTNNDNYIVLVQPKLEQYYESICKQLRCTTTIIEKRLYTSYSSRSRLIAHLNIVKEIFQKKRGVRKIDYLKKAYDELFVPSDDAVCRVVYFQLSKYSKQLKLYLYDDGLGTYDAHTFKNVSTLGKIVYKCMLNNKYCKDISRVYCYQPQLMAKLPEGVETYKVNSRPDTLALFNSFAKDRIAPYVGKKVIFLDQGLIHKPSVSRCLEQLKTHFLKEEMIVKVHPRIQGTQYEGFEISNDGLPFEAIMASLNLENCLLISHSSGACFTAYLLSSLKPYIILLIGIDEGSESSSPASVFFKRLIDSVGENNICLPTSCEELDIILEGYKVRFGNG